MKRIAIIAPHFQEYALLLANALAERSRVTLFIERDRLDREYEGRPMPVAANLTIRAVRFASVLDAFPILLGLAAFRPSVVHIQEPSGLLRAVICAVVTAFARPFCRIALTVHDPVPHAGRDTDIVRRIGGFRTYIRGAANLVLVHGQYCRDQYMSNQSVPGQRIVTTDHGVILAADAPETPAAPPVHILSFGRMEKYKGVEVLCEAAEILSGQGVDFRLTVAGSGPELDRLAPRLSAIRQVEVINEFVPSKALIRLIQSADCLALPYLGATQSGVLAAAFANGRFVIASRVGGIPDVVKHMVNGILVPSGDPVALAEAFRVAAVDPDLCGRLKRGACSTAESQLNWSRIAADLSVAYGA